jgi:hypothetical protein
MAAIAKERGVRLRMPMMDTHDQITPIPNENHQTILSERYHIAHQLIGTIYMPDHSVHWTLVTPNTHTSWNQRDIHSSNEALTQGLTHAIDALAEHDAIDQNKALAEKSQLVVHPIASLGELQKLLDYLKHIAMITQVQVDHVDGANVELSLSLQGNMQHLSRRLHQDGHLRLDPMHLMRHHITYTWQST